jgi:hypothetical protein
MKDPLWSAVLLFRDHTSSTFGFKFKFPGLFYPFPTEKLVTVITSWTFQKQLHYHHYAQMSCKKKYKNISYQTYFGKEDKITLSQWDVLWPQMKQYNTHLFFVALLFLYMFVLLAVAQAMPISLTDFMPKYLQNTSAIQL